MSSREAQAVAPSSPVADTTQVVWYQNPTWKKRVILKGKTLPDSADGAVSALRHRLRAFFTK